MQESVRTRLRLFFTQLVARLPLAVLLATAVPYVIFPVASEDIWWHLKAGELIWSLRAIPDADVFVHTVPAGTPWHSTQWVFQLLWYVLHELTGWNGLIVVRMGIAMAFVAMGWAWLRSEGWSKAASFFACLVFHFLARNRFNDRPEMISFLCFGAQMWLLSVPRGRFAARVAAFAAIQLLWANSHSSVVLGIAAPAAKAFAMLAERLLRRALGRPSPSDAELALQAREAAILAAVAAFLAPVSPCGLGIYTFGWEESQKKDINEFQPGWSVGWKNIVGVATLVCTIGAVRIRGVNQWWMRLMLAMALVEFSGMVRFMPYWAIMTLPLMAAAVEAPARSGKWRRWSNLAWRALLAVAIAWVAIGTFIVKRDQLLRWGVDETGWPKAAADFVIREDLRGKLFNKFNDGGYLVWRLVPDRKIFAFNETRLNEAVLAEGLRIPDEAGLRRWFEDTGVTYAIVGYNLKERRELKYESLLDTVSGWADWVPVFWDDRATVLVRRVPENNELIERLACVIQPESIPSRDNRRTDLAAFFSMRSDSAKWQAAGAELVRLEKESEAHFKASFALGLWHDVSGSDPQLALAAYERAEAIDPAFPELLSRMGQWHMKHGKPGNAVGYFTRAFAYADSKGDAAYNLAAAQYKMGVLDAAEINARRALEYSPGHAPALKLLERIEKRRTTPAPASAGTD